jgi:hypothetical protein
MQLVWLQEKNVTGLCCKSNCLMALPAVGVSQQFDVDILNSLSVVVAI